MNQDEAVALIDAYFLGEERDRESVFRRLAVWRTDLADAAPILRAVALVGARAADESLMALRVILGGGVASDSAVAAVKRAVAGIRKGDATGREHYFAAVQAAQAS